MDDPRFLSDLYRGTASYYDRFRVPYPPGLLADLAHRSGARGEGSLLDLGCGPGLISLAMHDQFSDIWAVDQEPGMIDVARQKAKTAGITHIRFLTSAAEDLSMPAESFDLVAIGNAFHRMPRAAVVARVLRWLRPGQFLALLWSRTPWEGQAPWQASSRCPGTGRPRHWSGSPTPRRYCPAWRSAPSPLASSKTCGSRFAPLSPAACCGRP